MDEECDVCGCTQHSTADCPEIQVTCDLQTALPKSLARQTLPAIFDIQETDLQLDVVCREAIPPRTRFGPLLAKRFPQPLNTQLKLEFEIVNKDGSRLHLDTSNEDECNWLCLVGTASAVEEQNCMAFQLDTDIYYSTTRQVECGESLKVWYARGYARKLRKPEFPPGYTEQENETLPPCNKEQNDPAMQMIEGDVDVNVDLSTQPAVDDVEGLEMLECQFLFTCSICGDVTSNNQHELDMHMILHSGTQSTPHSSPLVQKGIQGDTTCDTSQQEEIAAKTVADIDIRSFRCKQCSYLAKTTSDLALHITSVHLAEEITPVGVKKRVWTCAACGIVFSNPRSLGVHRKLHHTKKVEEGENNGPSFSKEDEKVESPQAIQLDLDSELVTGDMVEEETGVSVINVVIERQEEPCEDVKAVQYGRGQRKKMKPKHLDVSVVESDDLHECRQCGDVLPSEQSLDEHVVAYHALPCRQCKIKFTVAEEGLYRHACGDDEMVIDITPFSTRDTNNESTEYTCPHCQQIYSDGRVFYNHLVWHGNTFQCDICKGYSNTTEELENHVLICNGSENEGDLPATIQHRCQLCDLVCVSEQALLAHITMHTDYKCESCGVQYYTRVGLQKHLLSCDQMQLDKLGPVFACVECDMVFSTQHGLEYHNIQHSDLTITCKDCRQVYHNVPEFESHSCQAWTGKYVCEICEERFRSSRSLATHYLKHSLKFVCVICNENFEKKEDLIKHSLECSAKEMLNKKGRIDCAHCQKSFTDTNEYRTHLSEHTHTQQCTHCNRRFRKKHQLTQHLSRCALRAEAMSTKRALKSVSRSTDKHRPMSEIHHTCPVCSKSFVRKDYYLKHQCRNAVGQLIARPENLQLLEEPDDTTRHVICYQCGKVFTSQSNLTKHLKLHGKKENKCDACGKTFYHSHALRLHYDSTHTDKLKVPCDQCSRVFRNKYSLNQHIKQYHSSERTVYACEICGKIFKQKGNMTKHMLAHDSTRHHQCQYCDKSFKYPELLKRHSLIHTQGKQYQCDRCDRRFLVQYELTKHIKEMHSNKVYVCGICNESCRWKHTIRRHIKRKHPQHSHMADDSQYLTSLLRDATELDQVAIAKLHTELSHQVSQQVPQQTSHDMSHQVTTEPLVIPVDSLTPEQLVELAGEQIVTEGGTIHLYNQHAEGQTVEDLQKLTAILQPHQHQQQLLLNNQHITINLSNGQAIFSQVNLDEGREHNSIGASLLRSHTDGHVEVTNMTQAGAQVVIDQSDHQNVTHLPENTVLLTADGSIAYANTTHSQHDANFPDLSHLTDNSQDDSNKMMFFNILSNSETT